MSKNRKELSLKEKVQLVKESSRQSQRKLAEKFGIRKTQVWKTNKERGGGERAIKSKEKNNKYRKKSKCKLLLHLLL